MTGHPAARPKPSSQPAPDPRRAGASAATAAAVSHAPAVARPIVPPPPPEPLVLTELTINEGVTVKELAEKMDRKAKDIIGRLLARGILATMNQPLDIKMAVEICRELGFDAKVISFEEEVAEEEAKESKPGDLKTRDPVVTIMGHVDHGKTSLLDAVRSSDIVAGEAGGITQHIGAYHIRHKARGVTFIDTPGHEAFTMMRARGARVTDLVVLVVAADDGVMPQTSEAIDHARAAGVPIVVAINKVDKPGANIDRVKKQLSDRGLLVEDWGGQTVAVQVSAKQKTGIDELLEMILLVADIADLKADPSAYAAGTVLESRLDRSRGSVATVLVQRGTLRVGDPFIAGAVHGKVRAMYDDTGRRVREAGPSIPVEVLGLEGVPRAGDGFQVLEEEWRVRQIGAFRQQKLRQEAMAKTSRLTLDHLYQQITEGTVRELPLVVKADMQGSIEALTKTLHDLPSDKVKVRVIHAGSGAITPTDVLLASASNAISSATTSARSAVRRNWRNRRRSISGCTRSSTTSPTRSKRRWSACSSRNRRRSTWGAPRSASCSRSRRSASWPDAWSRTVGSFAPRTSACCATTSWSSPASCSRSSASRTTPPRSNRATSAALVWRISMTSRLAT